MSEKIIAIFDFDNTLIKGDSLWPFLIQTVGWPKAIKAASIALCALLFDKSGDSRTVFKAALLRHTLAGVSLAAAQRAAERLREKLQWLPTRDALMAHHQAGHKIVIASGGLNIYLPILLADLPHDKIIATGISSADGKLTGQMPNGNCVRQRKAERIAAYLSEQQNVTATYGYGNFPHDVPMLQQLTHRIIV